MATEIERKFLVISDTWRLQVQRSEQFRQGYLSNNPTASVRVRIENDQANLNIKGMTIGVSRPEYEYSIPLQDAQELLSILCQPPLIEKTRHYIEYSGKLWEIDEFHGDNQGLVVAEIELKDAHETFALPDWAGKDVSHEPRYYNVRLTQYPYRQWTADEQSC